MKIDTTTDRCCKEIVLKLDCELYEDIQGFIFHNNKLNIKSAIEKAIREFLEENNYKDYCLLCDATFSAKDKENIVCLKGKYVFHRTCLTEVKD